MQRDDDQWRPQADEENIEYDEESGRAVTTDPESMLMKFRENLAEQENTNADMMNEMARMKYEKAVRNRDPNEFWRDTDPLFGDSKPDFYKDESFKSNL